MISHNLFGYIERLLYERNIVISFIFTDEEIKIYKIM